MLYQPGPHHLRSAGEEGPLSGALKKALKTMKANDVLMNRPFTIKFDGPVALQIRRIVACSLDITEDDLVHTWVESYVRDASGDNELLLGCVADAQRRRRALDEERRAK